MNPFPKELEFSNAGFHNGRRLIRVSSPFEAFTSFGKFTVPSGFLSDGASIPQLAESIIGDPLGEYLEEAVVHDYLYSSDNNTTPPITRSEADLVLKELMYNKGHSFWKIQAFYAAVRLGGAKHFKRPQITMPTPVLPEKIVKIAISKIGLKEEPSGSNRGPQIQEFFDADNYDPNGPRPGDDGYPWCAAFVDRVVQLAMEDGHYTFKRPVTPSAFGLEDWSLAQDDSTHTKRHPKSADINPGDIVIFNFSHVGIATSAANFGDFETVEGNTNEAGSREGTVVKKRLRNVSQVRSRIRFMR